MTVPPPASRWTAKHVAGIEPGPGTGEPLLTGTETPMVSPGMDYWDLWPIQTIAGANASIGGGELWMSLAAPILPDPVERHGLARIHLLAKHGAWWDDLGPAFPSGWSPGSREWSGSAILEDDGRHVTVFFTAAGRRGESRLSYAQRIFQTRARLDQAGPRPRLVDWSSPREAVVSDGRLYDLADQAEGLVGEIKAFRDPGFFRDPRDGASYLVFSGSLPPPSSAFNGAIGIARATSPGLDSWTLAPPILHADGLNNELERPHFIHRDGEYYLFWSTQFEVFSPDGPRGPTGLYGAVGPSVFGPFEPLNGTGLVLANPPQAPTQAYSWLVLDDLSVTSFVNLVGPAPAVASAQSARARFRGGPAPTRRIRLDGSLASVIG